MAFAVVRFERVDTLGSQPLLRDNIRQLHDRIESGLGRLLKKGVEGSLEIDRWESVVPPLEPKGTNRPIVIVVVRVLQTDGQENLLS